MRHNLIVGVAMIALLLLASVANATIVTITDSTSAGDSPVVRDNCLRSDGYPDSNHGIVNLNRLYPDVGYPSGKGQRHSQFWFDLSAIPAGMTINSATLGVYFLRSGSAVPTVTGYKLSRFQAGKGWIEGLSDGDYLVMTNPGEPTWNSQKHQQVLWEVAGATGANDIDLVTTQSFDRPAGSSSWQTFDITAWVTDWVNNGVENNGMLIWGGVGPGGTLNAYWQSVMSEYTTDMSLRPYLTVDYVPEPFSALLLAAGSVLVLRRRRA